jgi:hypothetical protein
MPTGNKLWEPVLLVLQVVQIVFLWFHDWVPLGRLNDVAGIRSQVGGRQLVLGTLFTGIPWTLGLIFSAYFFGKRWPAWVSGWLWVSYTILFLGELEAWWVPYLIWNQPKRAAQYQIMYGNTHAFLPKRNGIVPNTAHCLLHSATAATLVTLFMKTYGA